MSSMKEPPIDLERFHFGGDWEPEDIHKLANFDDSTHENSMQDWCLPHSEGKDYLALERRRDDLWSSKRLQAERGRDYSSMSEGAIFEGREFQTYSKNFAHVF
ncbi:hypothetical protein HAX54_042685 [Datura stramonium]|uniref:Uncharacterized protein n=1 Tax=Datura stramonium TaxID=4076 RepID=A0ABS8W1K7_DATST|nr:hypothetical protein [Datura stramonium]